MLAEFRGDGVPVPAFVKTFKIYPKRSLTRLEFRVLCYDINNFLRCNSDPSFFPNKDAVEFTRVTPRDQYGAYWQKSYFLWFPREQGYSLPAAPYQGIDIQLSLTEYNWREGNWWNVNYWADVPVEVLLKIANAMDRHDIFVDTSMF